MSSVIIFGDDEFYVHDFLLSTKSSANIIVDSLFKGTEWYEGLSDANIEILLYCPDFPGLISRLQTINKTGITYDHKNIINIVLIAVDITTGKVISIGSSVVLNHEDTSLTTTFSISNVGTNHIIDSYKYNIAICELETTTETVGVSKSITRFTVPYGFIATEALSNDRDRYIGSLFSLKSLAFTTVSWVIDIQDGENYNTMSLYMCTVPHANNKCCTDTP